MTLARWWVLVGWLVLPSALGAQAKLTGLARDLEPLTGTGEVAVVPLGAFDPEPVELGRPLAVGDELRGMTGAVTVELTCPEGSTLTLAQQFRVVIAPASEGQDCAIDLLSGETHVLASAPTGVEAGEIGLATRRTQYEVRVRRDRRGRAVPEVNVYEGEVHLRAPGGRGPSEIRAGEKVRVESREPATSKVDKEDFQRTAAVYARVDATNSARRTAGLDPKALYLEFEQRHLEVLVRPEDPKARLELAVQQLNYGLPSRALYQLGRARVDPHTALWDKRLAAMIPFTEGLAYQQLGDERRAQGLYTEATKIDAQVADPASLESYRLHLRFVSRGEVATILQIEVRATVWPDPKAGAGIGATAPTYRVVVEAFAGGERVEKAEVRIKAGGGTFVESGEPEFGGATDSQGRLEATWFCSPCAPAYRFHVEVSKPGYEAGTADPELKIEPRS